MSRGSLSLTVFGLSVVALVAFGCRDGGLYLPPNDTYRPGLPNDDVFVAPGPAFGDGKDGDINLEGIPPFNDCFPLTSTESDYGVHIAGWDYSNPVGRVLLLYQVQASTTRSTGDQTPIGDESELGGAGAWQLVRTVIVDAPDVNNETLIATSPPPDADYRSEDIPLRRAQACTVPEFQDVTLAAAATFAIKPWDGNVGGVVAAMVAGDFTLYGVVDASGAGFSGGPASANDTSINVTNFDTNAGDGSPKGEGYDGRALALFGRGNYANGAGGGNASNAGGGGGGNGGGGGFGGKQTSNLTDLPNTRGSGGVGCTLSPDDVLTLGGGGGGGQQNDSLGGAGGNGGGLVLLITHRLVGSGSIRANGAPGGQGGTSTGLGDGAGGGGAGGTIYIRAGTSGFSGQLIATGGDGGDVRTNQAVLYGPGGGGGGGRILQDGLNVVTEVIAGARGINVDQGASPHSATAGQDGTVAIQ